MTLLQTTTNNERTTKQSKMPNKSTTSTLTDLLYNYCEEILKNCLGYMKKRYMDKGDINAFQVFKNELIEWIKAFK